MPETTNKLQEQREEAFSLGEANVKLEGFDPAAHPLYADLKKRVLAGEMTAPEMGEALIAYAVRVVPSISAA